MGDILARAAATRASRHIAPPASPELRREWTMHPTVTAVVRKSAGALRPLLSGLAALVLASMSSPSAAQDYPTKPVRII
jgi:hypothetical protein